MDDYSTEPRLIFTPLSNERYCEYYELEMSGYTADLLFYKSYISHNSDVLELGCGTGRLSHELAKLPSNILGIDISQNMVDRALQSQKTSARFTIGDMRSFTLDNLFDTIVIPYNTLNLLPTLDDIKACLSCCHSHLKLGGQILLHVFVPNEAILKSEDSSTFQFQIFDKKDYGKIIKESIKKYYEDTQSITLTERYRVRPTIKGLHNEELIHQLPLLAFHANKWLDIINALQFQVVNTFGNYQLEPFKDGKHSCLLIHATK